MKLQMAMFLANEIKYALAQSVTDFLVVEHTCRLSLMAKSEASYSGHQVRKLR